MTRFSRMRSKGSRFILGVGGWGCVRQTLRNRSRPSAGVRARAVWPCLWWGSKCRVASFRAAGVALGVVLTCLQKCRKSFCVASAILLRHFQKMSCSFRGRRSTLETSIVISRGKRSTSDVSHCVFLRNCQGCVKWWQRANSVAGVACCDMWLHSTLYTLQSALYTLQSTHYTPHSTLYTSHSTVYTPHFTLYSPHFTLYTLYSTLHTLHSTVFRISQSTVHWHGNRGEMYKTAQITCFTKVFYVTAFGFVGWILLFNENSRCLLVLSSDG